MKIYNLKTKGNYDSVNNIVVIHDGVEYFFSYQTLICIRDGSDVILDTNWDYSKTTNYYRNKFLRESKEQTKEKIKKSIYKVQNLN